VQVYSREAEMNLLNQIKLRKDALRKRRKRGTKRRRRLKSELKTC